MSGIVRSTNMRRRATASCLIRKESGTAMTQETCSRTTCRDSTSYAEDFLARLSQSLENGPGSQTREELSSLRSPGWLGQSDLTIFYLKMYPDCYRITKAGRSIPSSVRYQTWGITWNGRCLTARISESHSPENGCILSDILMQDVPEKYYLSREQTERLLYKSFQAVRGDGSTPQKE